MNMLRRKPTRIELRSEDKKEYEELRKAALQEGLEKQAAQGKDDVNVPEFLRKKSDPANQVANRIGLSQD